MHAHSFRAHGGWSPFPVSKFPMSSAWSPVPTKRARGKPRPYNKDGRGAVTSQERRGGGLAACKDGEDGRCYKDERAGSATIFGSNLLGRWNRYVDEDCAGACAAG